MKRKRVDLWKKKEEITEEDLLPVNEKKYEITADDKNYSKKLKDWEKNFRDESNKVIEKYWNDKTLDDNHSFMVMEVCNELIQLCAISDCPPISFQFMITALTATFDAWVKENKK